MYLRIIALASVFSCSFICGKLILPTNYNVFNEVDKYLSHVVEKNDPRLDLEATLIWTSIQPTYFQTDIFDPHMLQWWTNQLYLINMDLSCNQTNLDVIVQRLFKGPLTKGKIDTNGRLFKAIDYHLKLYEKRCLAESIFGYSFKITNDVIRYDQLKQEGFNIFSELDKYLNNVIKSDDIEINIKAAIEWLSKQDPNKGDYGAEKLASRLKELYGLRIDQSCEDSDEILRNIYNQIFVEHYDLIDWDGTTFKTILAYFRVHFNVCASIYKNSLDKIWNYAKQPLKDYISDVANTPKVCDFYSEDLRKDDPFWSYECLSRHEWIDESILANPILEALKRSKRANEDFAYLFNGDAKSRNRSLVEEDVLSLIASEIIMEASNYYGQTRDLLNAASFEKFLTGFVPKELNDSYRKSAGLSRHGEQLFLEEDYRKPLKKLVKEVTDLIFKI